MRRWSVLLAIAACDTPVESKAPERSYVYPPSLVAWPLGTTTGEIGRSQAPQIAMRDGITGSVVAPLRLPTVWQVPGTGAARAIVYGTIAGAHAVELIDIDKGTITWRDTTGCVGPVVGVTEEAVVCADGKGTRALGLDGKPRWSEEGTTFIAMTGERVVIAGVGETIVLDARLGDEVARVKLPVGVAADSIIASCGDAGRELFAYGQDGKLARIAEAKGGPALAWAVPVETVAGIDACEGATILITVSGTSGTALVALARETGAVVGRVDGVHGFWPARDGSDRIEVSSVKNVAAYGRDLVQVEASGIPQLGELLAKHGELRLVRATPLTAVLLDRQGVRAFIGLAHLGAALGEHSIIAASWIGSPGETVHRVAIPKRYHRQLRVSGPGKGLVLPAELRDLPSPVDIDGNAVLAKADAGQHGVAAVAIDPIDAHLIYVAALDHAPDQAGPTSVSRFDLKTHQWGWQRADGCGPGTPVGLAVTRALVVCAARDKRSSVRATARDGSARWEWTSDNVDAVAAAGSAVLVHDADRLFVLHADDGHFLATFASDDGGRMRAAVLELEGATLVVTAERNRIVAHVPAAHMSPAWAINVRGVVADIMQSADGLLVALEDGDAYRLDARTGSAIAIPGVDLAWRGSGELVVGETPGGPIPPSELSWLPPPPKAPLKAPPVPERDPAEDPPVLPRTWPTPPAMRASWQLALFELSGAVRAHNDYALAEPIAFARARGSRAPLVVQSGPGLRELLVIEPERGDPLRRVRLPEDAASGMAFSTIVDGKPLVGALLANPLRVVLF